MYSFFGQPDKKSLGTLEIILTKFAISRLHMNTDKRKIYVTNRGIELMDWCQKRNLDFRMLPGKYLGLPPLWSNKLLSMTGRLFSKIYTPSLHWLQVLPIPQEVADIVDRILRNYLWIGPYLKKALCFVNWEEVCKPISTRGLGIRKLSDMNECFLFKWLSKILSCQDSLRVEWRKSNYLEGKDFWGSFKFCST